MVHVFQRRNDHVFVREEVFSGGWHQQGTLFNIHVRKTVKKRLRHGYCKRIKNIILKGSESELSQL